MTVAADSEQVILHDHGPGKLKAVWHLEIITGKEAEALLEMQNQAIISLFTWALTQERPDGHEPGGDRETRRNDSRETLGMAA